MQLARVADERLHKALEKLSKEPLPLKTAFKLKGIIKTVKEEHEKYESVRLEALRKHGSKDADGNVQIDEATGNVKFEKEGLMAFAEEINELVKLEIDVPTINVDDLGNNIQITTEDLEALEGVIV